MILGFRVLLTVERNMEPIVTDSSCLMHLIGTLK